MEVKRIRFSDYQIIVCHLHPNCGHMEGIDDDNLQMFFAEVELDGLPVDLPEGMQLCDRCERLIKRDKEEILKWRTDRRENRPRQRRYFVI